MPLRHNLVLKPYVNNKLLQLCPIFTRIISTIPNIDKKYL